MVKCINCYQFGIFKRLVDEGTIWGHPETLDEGIRESISKNDFSRFEEALKKYHLYHQHLDCLSRTIVGDKKISQEEAFSNIGFDFPKICKVALAERVCQGFIPKNPILPYDIHKKLGEKALLDNFCDIQNTKMRREKLRLLQESLISLEQAEQSPQKRGKMFEVWFKNFLELYAAGVTIDIVNNYEQIDFTCALEKFHIIGEAKWTSESTSVKEVRDFFGKLSDRPPFVIGIIITMKGISDPAKQWLKKHSGERCVLTITKSELDIMLDQSLELPNWFNQQLRTQIDHP